jgi:hypothetical protein
MATNAFLAGLNKKNKQQGQQDDTGGGGGATSGFQSGFQMGQQKKQANQDKKQTAKATSTLQKAKNPDRTKASTASPDLGNAATIPTEPMQTMPNLPSYKHGGRVKKTGLALLHRGEFVVPSKQGRRKASGGKQRTYTKP